MKNKKMIGKAVALLMAATMLTGMVTTVSADEVPGTENGNSYEVNKVYLMDEIEFNNRGDAPEDYKWDYVMVTDHVAGRVDYDTLLCTQEEHTHGSEIEDACQGWIFNCTEEEHTHGSETEDACQGWTRTCGFETEHTHSSEVGGCQENELTCDAYHEHADACYDATTTICGKGEHEHNIRCLWGAACRREEHRHTNSCRQLTCEIVEHTEHTDACYTQHTCSTPEHVHSEYAGTCYTQKTCNKTEHAHSLYAGACYTQKSCDKTEHTHTDACYRYVEPVLAVYRCQLIPVKHDTGTNGNGLITISVNVTDDSGKGANGVGVTLGARDINSFAQTQYLTLGVYTNLNGVATFDISGTYDYITSIVITDAEGDTTELIKSEVWIGLSNNNVSYSHKIEGHNHVENAASAVAPTCEVDGKHADQICSYCGDTITGEVIDATGHDYQLDTATAVAATFTAEGYEGDYVCQHEGCTSSYDGNTIDRLVAPATPVSPVTPPTPPTPAAPVPSIAAVAPASVVIADAMTPTAPAAAATPATPVTTRRPVVVADVEEEADEVEIEEEETPLADGTDEEEVEVTAIEDEETPLAAEEPTTTETSSNWMMWLMIGLALAAACVIIFIILLKKKDEDEEKEKASK